MRTSDSFERLNSIHRQNFGEYEFYIGNLRMKLKDTRYSNKSLERHELRH